MENVPYRQFLQFIPQIPYEPNELFANMDGPWVDLGTHYLSPDRDTAIAEANSQFDHTVRAGHRVLLVPQQVKGEIELSVEPIDFTVSHDGTTESL